MTLSKITMSKITKTGLVAVAGLGLGLAAPSYAQTTQPSAEGLASASLAEGQALKAIRTLEAELKAYPDDPALHINLGIALAHSGNEAKARGHFETALASREVLELDTADGRTTDSRRLARQAIAMLERGDFRPAMTQPGQLTLRD